MNVLAGWQANLLALSYYIKWIWALQWMEKIASEKGNKTRKSMDEI